MGECPSCSGEVELRWNVCPWCGHDLEESPALVRLETETVSVAGAAKRGLLRQPWVWILVAAGAIGSTANGLSQREDGPILLAAQPQTTTSTVTSVTPPLDESIRSPQVTPQSVEPTEPTAPTTPIIPPTTTASSTTTTQATTTTSRVTTTTAAVTTTLPATTTTLPSTTTTTTAVATTTLPVTTTTRPPATTTTAPATTTTTPATTTTTTTTPSGIPPNPGDSKNCSDFSTQAEAQAWFDLYYPHYGDIARLDGSDNDQIACENLP